jgi:hypothetical protein
MRIDVHAYYWPNAFMTLLCHTNSREVSISSEECCIKELSAPLNMACGQCR